MPLTVAHPARSAPPHQVIKCADAGAEIVRITVQGMQEAKACLQIKNTLLQKGYTTPLVADIHFAPKVAMLVAECFDKIRINPGNFADGRKTFEEKNYDDEAAYKAELDYIEEVFTPLVHKCKERNVAMRIGTNHGSLSARTLSYYGDTPAGMVESAFEFARICRKHDYHNFLFSMKASNPLVMVAAYRLLAHEQYKLGWDYPLHLGVTEAGEGEDGRMKSSIGIGALLLDGLGDTIRVSLTEAPELEIDPCTRLRDVGTTATKSGWGVGAFEETHRSFTSFDKRRGTLPAQREGDALDFRPILHRDGSVLSAISLKQLAQPELLFRDLGAKLAVGMPFKDIATSDSLLLREVPPVADAAARLALRRLQESGLGILAPAAALAAAPLPNAVALFTAAAAAAAGGKPALPAGAARWAVTVDGSESDAVLSSLKGSDAVLVLLETPAAVSRVHASRRVFETFARAGVTLPVIHHLVFPSSADKDAVVIGGGSQAGALLVDGLGDGVLVEAPSLALDAVRTLSFGMLQGSRMRSTKTEFVSCPSCGRTLFDLQEVTRMIQDRTGHLPGVAIAVMGCIVNGPGEMADADFGYVGTLPGKIDLYVGKEVVKRNIPNDQACDELVQLIKDHGRWIEKEVAVAA
jgi:(E)-4-hydroxy-3-methylbut-2-enyl-diphosphate synthase